MAAPNLRSPSVVTGRTACLATAESAVPLLVNTASSGKVLKVNALRVVAPTATTRVSVKIVRDSDEFWLASSVSVAGGSMLILLNKDEYLYLEEGDTLKASHSAGYASANIIANYEEIA